MKKFSETMIERMKASFIPQVDDKARLAMDGTVCVRTNTANGKEWLGVKGNEIVAYPEDLLLEDVPVFTIAKTINQVKIGDIVKATSSTYARVEKIKDGQIYSTSFGGNMRKNVPVTDFLTQQKTVRVVVNPFGAAGGADMNNNVMLMMLLDNKEEKDGDLAELMMLGSMLSGQGVVNPFDNIMNNPMALIAFAGKSGSSMKDIMMLNMLRQGGLMNPVKVEEIKEEAKEEVIFIPEEKIEE
jgi:hypothetical protein